MKLLTCQVENLDCSLLGKVTFKSRFLQRKDWIFINHEATTPKYGYQATLSSSEILKENLKKVNTNQKSNKSSLIYCTNDVLEQINEGDVVQINPNGQLTVLIEANSNANFLALTEKCNHRCIMCPQPPVTHEQSRLDFNLRLINFMPSTTRSICITGGEPTLVGDDLFLILDRLKKHSPNISITILTNAVKLSNNDFTFKLARFRDLNLQVDVPLFGATPELHNHIVGAKTFYKTIQGIYNLAKCGVQVGIRVVIHKLTYQHLSSIAYFVYHNFPFVNQVAFMQMETIGYAQDNIEQLWIDPYDYKDELSYAVNFLRERNINVLIFNAQLCVLNPDVRDVAVQSISDWKNISLETCNLCTKRNECAGFFASNAEFHSKHIKPFTN